MLINDDQRVYVGLMVIADMVVSHAAWHSNGPHVHLTKDQPTPSFSKLFLNRPLSFLLMVLKASEISSDSQSDLATHIRSTERPGSHASVSS